MNRKLYHPLWTHMPAVLILVCVILSIEVTSPLPPIAPVHFGMNGRPDHYGSPWQVLIGVIGLSVLYIAISVLIDELWARQENRKSFNWISFLDEVTVGALSGLALSYLKMLSKGGHSMPARFEYMLTMAGLAAVGAFVVETQRPYMPHEQHILQEDPAAIEKEIAERREAGTAMVYLESQNPAYNTVLVALTTLAMACGAAASWVNVPLVSAVMMVLAIVFLIPYGGLRVMVTPNRLLVHMGIVGVPLLDLDTANIASVEVIDFAPLRDFGGYGIRFGRGMKAYFFRGTRGVVVTATSGKKYLIGSDQPEKLAAVLRAVVE